MSFSGPVLFYVNISVSKLCPGPLVDELNLQEFELELGGGKQVFIFDELVEESNCHDNKINSFFCLPNHCSSFTEKFSNL